MKPARILLVEDNETDAFLLRHAFEEHDLQNQLQVVKDGALAGSILIQPDAILPDLIILDINLPKVDGLTLLALVRGLPRYDELPVVMLTSSQAPDDRRRALALGVDAFLHKAGSLDDFLALGAVIKQLLESKGRKTNVRVLPHEG